MRGGRQKCNVYSWQYWVLQNGQNLRTKMPKVLRQDNNLVEIRFNTSKLYCAKCIAPLQEEPVLISLKTKHGCSLVGTFCCRSRIAGFVSACGPLARKLLKLLKAKSGFPWSLSLGFDISVQRKSSQGTVEARVTHRIKSLMIFHDFSLWICSSPLHLYKAGHEWLWITGLGRLGHWETSWSTWSQSWWFLGLISCASIRCNFSSVTSLHHWEHSGLRMVEDTIDWNQRCLQVVCRASSLFKKLIATQAVVSCWKSETSTVPSTEASETVAGDC